MVEVDDRGRFTIPREIGVRGAKVVVISAGTYFLVIPIAGNPYDYAKDWLKTEETPRNLKHSSEKLAAADAEKRHARRAKPC